MNVPGSSSLATVQALACKAFGWSEAELVSSETGLPLADDAALTAEVDAWAGAEEARRTDTLEAHLESIRSLVSTSAEVRRTSAQLGAVLRRNSAQFSGATRRNSQPLSPFTRSYISRDARAVGARVPPREPQCSVGVAARAAGRRDEELRRAQGPCRRRRHNLDVGRGVGDARLPIATVGDDAGSPSTGTRRRRAACLASTSRASHARAAEEACEQATADRSPSALDASRTRRRRTAHAPHTKPPLMKIVARISVRRRARAAAARTRRLGARAGRRARDARAERGAQGGTRASSARLRRWRTSGMPARISSRACRASQKKNTRHTTRAGIHGRR